MYEFVRGPMMLISFAIFVLGLSYRIYQLFRITRKKIIKEYPIVKKKIKLSTKLINTIKSIFTFNWLIKISFAIKDSVLGNQPFVSLLSFIFHLCMIITPIFLVAHNILLLQSWGVSIFTFSEFITGAATTEYSKYICHCSEGSRQKLKEIYRTGSNAIAVIGPEGDFTPEEIELAEKYNFQSVTLGSNRLRTETAGLAICQILNFLND